jgi:hypothetical protein
MGIPPQKGVRMPHMRQLNRAQVAPVWLAWSFALQSVLVSLSGCSCVLHSVCGQIDGPSNGPMSVLEGGGTMGNGWCKMGEGFKLARTRLCTSVFLTERLCRVFACLPCMLLFGGCSPCSEPAVRALMEQSARAACAGVWKRGA